VEKYVGGLVVMHWHCQWQWIYIWKPWLVII